MPPSKVLVVGSGAIGLRTSLELLRRNVRVVLRSPRSPTDPSVCSQGAGGLWMPFHCDDPRTDRWARETLDEIHPLGKDPSCSSVELVPTLVLLHNNSEPGAGRSPPSWSSDPRLDFSSSTTAEMFRRQKNDGDAHHRLRIPPEKEFLAAGYDRVWFFVPPVVDCPRMLESMLSDVRRRSGDDDGEAADVDVETGIEYGSVRSMVDDAKNLGCDAVVNCTGLGARDLCGDGDLVGARGILHRYDRRSGCVRRGSVAEGKEDGRDANILVEEGPWGSAEMPCYMIARGDSVVIGGSYLEGDAERGIRDDERSALLENARRMGIDTERSSPVGEWTGFRPYRPLNSRLELDPAFPAKDDDDGVRVVHSYGYGGSGWTVYVGAAKEAARLLMGPG